MEDDEKEKPTFVDFVLTHILLIVFTAVSFALWLLVRIFWPDFFDPFQYWLLTDNIPWAVIQSWPFFLYGFIGAILGKTSVSKKLYKKETVLAQDIYTSVMAGVLEEAGYRCLFIFTSMIPIAIANFVLFGIVMWLYGNLIFPLTNILTLGLMQGTIYGFPALYIAGALSANAAFRDGHKYQGFFGYLNAWFAGLYLLTVMLAYGLLVAILVHMLYDLIFAFVRYSYSTSQSRKPSW